MPYLPCITKLPGSENIGVIEGFPFDEDGYFTVDDDSYYFRDTVDELEYEITKEEFSKKCPRAKWPRGRVKDYQQKVDAYYAWEDKFDKVLEKGTYRKLAEKAARKQLKEEYDKYLAKLVGHIKKSEFDFILASTNSGTQKTVEKMLRELKFTKLLTFTNPNHDREDNLHIWSLRK